MKTMLIRSLAVGVVSLTLLAPQAKALEIIGQLDMTGVALFNAPLATATQVTAWGGARAAIATGSFAAGGVYGDPLFGDIMTLTAPWVFANSYSPLWAVTGSLAPNATFSFDGLNQPVTVNQVNGFLEVMGSGVMKSSNPQWDDTPYTWRFTSQGTGPVNKFSFSASAFRPTGIPDGGLTLGLLGMALMGVEALRRKLAK